MAEELVVVGGVGGGEVDDLEGRGPQGTTVSAADGGSSAVVEPVVSESVAADGGVRAPVVSDGGGGSGEGWQSIREVAERLYGYKFGEDVTDDAGALRRLIEQARVAQQQDVYAQVGRQLAPHAEKVAEYVRRQEKAPEEVSRWDRPEFDEKWIPLLDDGPGGVLVGKAGTPPEIVTAANRYLEWKRLTDRDPAGYQGYLFEKNLMPRVREMLAEERGRIAEEMEVQAIVASNAGWLYAKTEDGQYQRQADGRPALSPAGVRYSQLVQQAAGMGVRSFRNQDQFARTVLSAEVLAAQQQRHVEQKGSTQQRQASMPPNRNPVNTQPLMEREASAARVADSGTGKSLRQMMADAFEANGITDKDIDLIPS